MSQSYKIIKLKSGEELIATVSQTDGGNFLLDKPMVFKTVMISDHTGLPREGIVLKNWLLFGTETQTTIPSDFIATMLEPTRDVVSHYLLQKEMQIDSVFETKELENFAPKQKKTPPSPEEYENMISDMFASIFEDLDLEEEAKSKRRPKNKSNKNDMNKDHIIHMNMVFGPEVLAFMINEGLIDPRDIMEMIEHFNLNNKNKKKKRKNNRESINDKKFTGDQTDRKDFGNKWTDWNPDPDSTDYKWVYRDT